MKKILSALLLILITTSFLSEANAAKESIDAKMELTARLVTIKGQPYFTARGKGTLEYESIEDGAIVYLKSFPTLIYESNDPPPGFEELTVVITGVLGTTATVDWSNYPEVDLRDLKLHIEAYDASLDEIDTLRPFLSTTVSDIDLSTKPIYVEGVSSGGYVDPGNLEVQMAGKVIAPDNAEPLYERHIAGEPILLELLIKILNPFRK